MTYVPTTKRGMMHRLVNEVLRMIEETSTPSSTLSYLYEKVQRDDLFNFFLYLYTQTSTGLENLTLILCGWTL